tara:strand:+ start:5934 stop:6848 length:915 start_codon:yes stop_codon:yes gene_type:complete
MKVCQYKECEVSYLVMKYLEPLIQLFSGTISEYNMQMKTTKCLNTAVMLTYILGGSDKLKKIQHCEVSKINKRFEKKSNKLKHKTEIFNKLKSDLSKKNIRKRYFYYILITNTYMDRSRLINKNLSDTQFFPGHVFIIDKYPVCKNENAKYNIYQSYIDKYDLKGFYKKNRNSMNLKNNNIDFLLSGINNIISNPVWNQESVDFWNDFTFVNTDNLLNYKTDKLNLCYSKIRIDYCYREFQSFIKKHKDILEKDIKNNINLDKYTIENMDIYDEFYIKQLNPQNLLKKLNLLYNELGNKIKMYE